MSENERPANLPAVATESPSHGGIMDLVYNAPEERFKEVSNRIAFFAQSQLVPTQYRGKPADLMVALEMARNAGEDPITYLQNTFLIGGNPGHKASYLVAKCRKAGVFTGPIRYEVIGEPGEDSFGVIAKANLAEGGEEVASPAVTMEMAKADGWTKNQKYQSMPEVMLRWRAAVMLIRFYAPEVMLNVSAVEELETTTEGMRDVTPPLAEPAEDKPKAAKSTRRKAKAEPKVTDVEPEAAPAEPEPEAKVEPAPAAATEPAPEPDDDGGEPLPEGTPTLDAAPAAEPAKEAPAEPEAKAEPVEAERVEIEKVEPAPNAAAAPFDMSE